MSTGRVEPSPFSSHSKVRSAPRQDTGIQSVHAQSHSHTPAPQPSARRGHPQWERERGKLRFPFRQPAHWLANYSDAQSGPQSNRSVLTQSHSRTPEPRPSARRSRQQVRRVRAPEEGVRFLLAIGWRLPMLQLVIAVTATAPTVAATDNVVAAPTITVPSPPPLQLPSPDP